MQQSRYIPLSDSEHEAYEFLGSGPKGTIKKIIQFVAIDANIYNLQFGDWDEDTQMIRDDVRSNNEDRSKVLATVAFTVFDFMKHHPQAIIFARGSTIARTRLYQMGISENLVEIKQMFDIQGYIENGWEPFRKGKNYLAFYLKAR
ncbi:hypothetical protein HHL16_20430 [Pseudoflavitalea sp. G-6-1-2]|uniref:DUF6934 family protein n=1 Tax=Pseudoflavitalea sp. G-6-1-2 TaxID=2728841 RepID=UPI00146EA98F|nr:hypothetical protein [Pseudoflavitalea sp. G-6-1-2]NML23257.1 hypothetical protein [Pseudoflavitalea sp. G-6-1-2]